jgi:hypothetical protein
VSLVIGLNAGAYVMVAADFMITWINDAGQVTGYSASARKIRTAPHAMIAGTGYMPLLEPVYRRVLERPFSSFDEVLEIIGQERERFAASGRSQFKLDHGLNETGWLVSARVLNQENQPLMVLVTYHPSHGHQLDLCGVGTIAPLVPIGETGDADAIRAAALRRLSECVDAGDTPGEIAESIEWNARLLRLSVADCARAFPSISRACTIGVHAVDGSITELPHVEAEEGSAPVNGDDVAIV